MGLQRRSGISNEKFYTRPDVAKELIDLVRAMSWFATKTRVIEPSAGAGAFSGQIVGCEAYDIEPGSPDVVCADFLSLDLSTDPERTLVIGNPPFGRQCSLALRFIRRACALADHVAFILPLSFMKESVQARVPHTHHLSLSHRLPVGSFETPDGRPFVLLSVFQVWERRAFPREKRTFLRRSDEFDFVSKSDANLAFVRVGGRAGRAITGPEVRSTNVNCHHYVRTPDPEALALRINSIDWSSVRDIATGPRSISKHEFLSKLSR